ncbi:MAG: hypothetical protein LBQ60_12445 [Bacteroidales bacterium]|jgi:hypothetical protein|nr:hypothetical protein [Bacteroidales bacterium]
MRDLHDNFVKTLYSKVPKKTDLANKISDILLIEKESAYRRLTGKVQFSVREMGTLANTFNISIDNLLHLSKEYQWLPFSLDAPYKSTTIDVLCDIILSRLKRMIEISQMPAEIGGVHNSIPLEFSVHHPLLMKFLFFKWGHYFVGTEEFENFSEWEIPCELNSIKEKIEQIHCAKILYIWDNSLIWTLANEIEYFYRIHAITAKEKEELKEELKKQLTQLEQYLKGTFIPENMIAAEAEFYVSMIGIGVTCQYHASQKECLFTYHTNFSQAFVDNCYENCIEWINSIKSLRKTSVLLSGSGGIERRSFFNKQHQIIDLILG